MWNLVTVEEAGFSKPRARRLARAGYITVADLQQATREELQRIYWFGKGGLAEVDDVFRRLGLPLIPDLVRRTQTGALQ